MNAQVLVNAAGGLALFLLAMLMMTEGLKVFAGAGLKQLLARWTSTPMRGVLSGMLVTGLVQSSSAVTMAAIGFVNAGVLTLRQGLGVIYGTNVGTTMTGWLVSLVGFGFRVENFALPILAVGVALRIASPGKRYQALGEAVAGFGLFFLGLALLKDAFTGVADTYGAAVAGGDEPVAWPAFLAVGFVATVLTQSSSAAIAIILTAAAGGVVGLDGAAAAVIGANVGTTSKALLAATVMKATSSARRLAMGHIAFNVITAAVALALLPVLLWIVDRLADWLDVDASPAATLALFHTVFNVLGVAIMLPLSDRLAALLERLFRTAEEDLARPQHLDVTLASTPELAVSALREELLRLRSLVASVTRDAARIGGGAQTRVDNRAEALRTLGVAIAGFVATVRTAGMPADLGHELARGLRIARYLDEAVRLAPAAAQLRVDARRAADAAVHDAALEVLDAADRCIALADRPQTDASPDTDRAAALDRFEATYEEAKNGVLTSAVGGRLSVEMTRDLLDHLSNARRMVEQIVKADRLLRSPARAAVIETEAEQADEPVTPDTSAAPRAIPRAQRA